MENFLIMVCHYCIQQFANIVDFTKEWLEKWLSGDCWFPNYNLTVCIVGVIAGVILFLLPNLKNFYFLRHVVYKGFPELKKYYPNPFGVRLPRAFGHRDDYDKSGLYDLWIETGVDIEKNNSAFVWFVALFILAGLAVPGLFLIAVLVVAFFFYFGLLGALVLTPVYMTYRFVEYLIFRISR